MNTRTGIILSALIIIPASIYGGIIPIEELVSGIKESYTNSAFENQAGDYARELISRGDEAVSAVLKALEKDDLPDSAQSTLCYVLDVINDESVSPRLIDLLRRTDVARNARIRISKLLERWDKRAAIPIMLEIVKDKNEERNLRIVNIRILGRWGISSALTCLVGIASDEQDELFVRYKAIQMLENFNQPEASAALIGLLSKPIKRKELLTERAIITLGKKKDKSAVDTLMDLLQEDISPILIKRCVLSLGEIGDERAVPALKELLNSEERMIRDYSSQVLRKLTGKEVEAPERAAFPERKERSSKLLSGPKIRTE